MLLVATQKNTRQTARKVRLVADAIRGKEITEAVDQLAIMNRRASLVVLKALNQALANAQHNHSLSADQLVLKNILVDEGPTYKRFRVVSRGRAHTILKRSCHITIQLETQAGSAKQSTELAPAEVKKEAKQESSKSADAKKTKSVKSATASTADKTTTTTKKTTNKTKNKEQKS